MNYKDLLVCLDSSVFVVVLICSWFSCLNLHHSLSENGVNIHDSEQLQSPHAFSLLATLSQAKEHLLSAVSKYTFYIQ